MQFTKHEIKLLHHHMHFYDELRTGVKKADTPEREHFVKAVKGEVEAKTDHEIAYIKYLNSNMQVVDNMIHKMSFGKMNKHNPNFDDELF